MKKHDLDQDDHTLIQRCVHVSSIAHRHLTSMPDSYLLRDRHQPRLRSRADVHALNLLPHTANIAYFA